MRISFIAFIALFTFPAKPEAKRADPKVRRREQGEGRSGVCCWRSGRRGNASSRSRAGISQ